MKKNFILAFLILSWCHAPAQLRKIGRDVKNDIEWKVNSTAKNKADKAIDTLVEKATEKKESKKSEKNNTVEPKTETAVVNSPDPKSSESQNDPAEGFITLRLSTPITSKGLSVTISGVSIKHEKWNAVKIHVKAPNDEEEVTVALDNEGKYSKEWNKLMEEGDYIITATSSDGKAKVSERLMVIDYFDLRNENAQLIEVTGKAFERLKKATEDVKPFVSQTDAAKLNDKLNAVKENVDALNKAMASLAEAKKEVGNFIKKGGIPSQSLLQNMTDINLSVMNKVEEVKKISARADHPPFDNTICEYLTMLNEACAAFETFTNVWAKSVSGIVRNIMLDKALPKANATVAGAVAPAVFKSDKIGEEYTWGVKKATKIFATAQLHMDEFHHKLGQAEFASAMVRFATDVLMRTHCGIFKGNLKHYYNYYATNAQGKKWWDYAVTSQAALTLRYPKSSSGIIKMKGTIEGNATKFDFFADPASNPEYAQGTAGKVQTMLLKNYTPLTLPSATSLHDVLGFGMVARAVVTPAYFLIPVDAEYNTETGKLKLFINTALADYLEPVFNSQIFIQWVAGLPKLRRQDYPIQKARLTMNATLKEKNEFTVTKDPKGNLIMKGTIKRHLKGEAGDNEHFMDITIDAKKE